MPCAWLFAVTTRSLSSPFRVWIVPCRPAVGCDILSAVGCALTVHGFWVPSLAATILWAPLTFCEALSPRASRRFSCTLSGRAVWPPHTGGVPWRHLHSVSVCRTSALRVTLLTSHLQPSLRLLAKCLMVSGHRSASSALLI